MAVVGSGVGKLGTSLSLFVYFVVKTNCACLRFHFKLRTELTAMHLGVFGQIKL